MASQPSIFCTKCGKKPRLGDRFCANCGNPVQHEPGQDTGVTDTSLQGVFLPPNPGGNISISTPWPTQPQANQQPGTQGPHGMYPGGQQLPQFSQEQMQWLMNMAMRFPSPGTPEKLGHQTSPPVQHHVENETTQLKSFSVGPQPPENIGSENPPVTPTSQDKHPTKSSGYPVTPASQDKHPTTSSDYSKQHPQDVQSHLNQKADVQKKVAPSLSNTSAKTSELDTRHHDLEREVDQQPTFSKEGSKIERRNLPHAGEQPPTPLPSGESIQRGKEIKDSKESMEQIPPLEEASESSEDNDEQETALGPERKPPPETHESPSKQKENAGTEPGKTNEKVKVEEKERLKDLATKKPKRNPKIDVDENNDKGKEQLEEKSQKHPLNEGKDGKDKEISSNAAVSTVSMTEKETAGNDDRQNLPKPYIKSKTEPEHYIPGQQKEKKKKKGKSSKETDIVSQSGEEHQIPKPKPYGLNVTPGQDILVHFHTIISADFNFNPGSDTVVVRFGGDAFGHWQYNCLEMEVERELPDQFFVLKGSLRMRSSLVNEKMIPYKYVVRKQDVDRNVLYVYEYIHKENDTWNRCLRVRGCSTGGIWHQYDDTMQMEHPKEGVFKKMTNAAYSLRSYIPFINKESKPAEVDRLVHGRQLAMLSYLPKWEGFVTSKKSDKMTPVAALKQIRQVCESTMNARVTVRGYADYAWKPRGFSGESLLCDFLSEKLDSFTQGSSSDSRKEDNENRLVSALAIAVVVSLYDLPLSPTQWTCLVEGLRFPVVSRTACNSLLKTIAETFNQVINDVTEGLVNLCKKCFNQNIVSGTHDWLFALPILHFLRGDCSPYSAPAEGPNTNRKWWGVSGLKIDNLQIPAMTNKQATVWKALLDQLFPLFELDQLLPRSVVYLQLSPIGVTRFIRSGRLSSTLMCGAMHVVLLQQKGHITNDDEKHIAENLRSLSGRVIEMNKSTRERTVPFNQSYQQLETSCNVVTTIFSKRWRKTKYSVLLEGCALFAASYVAFLNASTIATRSQDQHMNGAYQMAQRVLKLLLEWLHKEMPMRITYDGKRLEFVNEFDIWNRLLSIELGGEFAATWKQQLLHLLTMRIKQINNDDAKVELFCNFDTSTTHADLSQVLSDSAFSGLDRLVQEKGESRNMLHRWLHSSNKFGSLLSRVFIKAWPAEANKTVILQHMLTWTPLINFFKITVDEKTAYGDIFSEDAQFRLVEAKSLFEDVCKKLIDGSILIGQLKLITKSRCSKQFEELYKALQMPSTEAKSGTGTRGHLNVTALLEARRKEVKALEEQMQLNDCLLRMCKSIDPVDCKELDIRMHTDITARQLTQVCIPISPEDLSKKGLETNITFFMHPSTVDNMLQPLFGIQNSHVFNKLWRRQAVKVRKKHPTNILSLEEVATLVWHPVYNDQLQETSTKLSTGLINLGEVDFHFKELYMRQPTLLEGEVTKVMSLGGEADPLIIGERLGQIEDYYRYQQQSATAGEILNVKEAFGLTTGDFSPMEILHKVSSDEFKKKPLSSISKAVVNAAEELKTVGVKERSCLKELSKCNKLINWIRKEIQDEKQLRVFVELAGNNAGETAMEVDRVLCFHRAATGYASFIFDLKHDAGYLDLLRVCKKVWKALENDPGLPALLVDTQKELPWLRQVKESQGDVETSSLIQAEAINTRGIYTIGKIDTKEKVKGETDPTLQLRVTAEDRGEKTDKSRDRERVYYSSGLKDLQSRLTRALVAGKAKDLRRSLALPATIRAGQADIEYFVEIFTAAQQLAESYKKLTQAGNILFSEWRAILYCGYQEGVSVHVNFGVGNSGLLVGVNPLTAELRFLREFMTTCLREWYQYVEDRRSEYYELNYFTTAQLVLLRQSLAGFAKQERDLNTNEESRAEIHDLSPQVYCLLSNIKHHCNRNDIENALRAAARDILKPPMDEATIAELAEAEKEAAKMEAAKNVVQELKDGFEIDEKLAWASIQVLGQEKSIEEYMAWCVNNVENEALVENLTASLKISDADNPGIEDNDEGALYGFPSQTKTFKDVASDLLQDIVHKRKVRSLKKQLTQLWHDYLHSMKSTDVEDCLSLEHLGLILQHLAKADENPIARGFPTSLLKEGQPNLIVCQTCDVLTTVLSIYMHDGGRLPTTSEVLVCSPDTTLEEVSLLWRRSIGDAHGNVFCLVRADLLDYEISVKAEQRLSELMRGRMGNTFIKGA